MKQVPFIAKQTVGTPHIRKDVWTPLATVQFPSGDQGLAAYKKLREFGLRHLAEWKLEDLNAQLRARGTDDLGDPETVWSSNEEMDPKGDWPNMPTHKMRRWYRRKKVGPAVQDQKANSIADLAYVMQKQHEAAIVAGRKTEEERALNEMELEKANKTLADYRQRLKSLEDKDDEASRAEYKDIKLKKMKIRDAMQKPMPYAALTGRYHIKNDGRIPAKRGPLKKLRTKDRPRTTMEGVKIEWANILDKAYAKEWPATVSHELLPQRGQRIRTSSYQHTTELMSPADIAEYGAKQTAAVKEATKEETLKAKEVTAEETSLPPKSRMQSIIDRLKFGAR